MKPPFIPKNKGQEKILKQHQQREKNPNKPNLAGICKWFASGSEEKTAELLKFVRVAAVSR